MMDIRKALNWRYATKKFDTEKKVSDEDFDELIEAARLAPSSFGLQPWKFVVVTDPVLRKKLHEHSGQNQVTDASHLIVLTVRTDLNANYIKEYIRQISAVRNVPIESLKAYEQMMLDQIRNMTHEEIIQWSTRQVYIALGFLLETAALMHIDSCPMEGFDAEKFDELLGLKEEHLHAVALCPIGYRALDDRHSQHAKVRFDAKEIVVRK
jgi:nitroreductase